MTETITHIAVKKLNHFEKCHFSTARNRFIKYFQTLQFQQTKELFGY